MAQSGRSTGPLRLYPGIMSADVILNQSQRVKT